jgi:hypothetical protein
VFFFFFFFFFFCHFFFCIFKKKKNYLPPPRGPSATQPRRRVPHSYNPRGLDLGVDPDVVSVFSNFPHYGLSPGLDVVRMDITSPAWRGTTASEARSEARGEAHGWLDAVITDPPYGVRAGARRAVTSGGLDRCGTGFFFVCF